MNPIHESFGICYKHPQFYFILDTRNIQGIDLSRFISEERAFLKSYNAFIIFVKILVNDMYLMMDEEKFSISCTGIYWMSTVPGILQHFILLYLHYFRFFSSWFDLFKGLSPSLFCWVDNELSIKHSTLNLFQECNILQKVLWCCIFIP